MTRTEELHQLEQQSILNQLKPQPRKSQLHWFMLAAATAMGVVIVLLMRYQKDWAIGLGACLITGFIFAGMTYLIVAQQAVPIQVRFGQSTICVQVDMSPYSEQLVHRLTAAVAEYALECLKTGHPPAWRQEAPAAVREAAAEPGPRPASPLAEAAPAPKLAITVPAAAEDNLCYSCKRRPGKLQPSGKIVCSICKSILQRADGEEEELQMVTSHSED